MTMKISKFNFTVVVNNSYNKSFEINPYFLQDTAKYHINVSYMAIFFWFFELYVPSTSSWTNLATTENCAIAIWNLWIAPNLLEQSQLNSSDSHITYLA